MIEIKNLNKSYNGEKIFNNFSLEIKDKEITAIIGPNGCGKSTLLNILAGLVKKDSGDFKIADFNPFRFSYLFQNYRDTLLPWRKNIANLCFPLEIQKINKEDIRPTA